MFNGLTKSRFYTKCKSLTKMTKTRLEAMKKKKGSVVKFLNNDIAELLRSGFDYNAYGRAEGLLVEQNMLACYNFMEQFCGCISSNVSPMNRQRECPKECKEAVQSLIYAAARFSEFPELRELRNLFTERYGTSLESFINKEFVEMLRAKPASKEMKLQLLHDIAQEYSLEWNSKSLEQKLFKPLAPQQNQHRLGSLDDNHEGMYKWKKSNADTIPDRDNQDDDGYKWNQKSDNVFTKRDSNASENTVHQIKEQNLPKGNEAELSSHGRKNFAYDRYKLQSSSEDEVFSVQRTGSTDLDSLQASSSSVGSTSEDECESMKPSYSTIPPPYLKSNPEKEGSKRENSSPSNRNNGAEATTDQGDLDGETKPKPRSVRRRPLKPPPGHETVAAAAAAAVERPLKPPPGREVAGSVERPLKPPPGREKLSSVESNGVDSSNSSSRKQEAPRRYWRFFQADDCAEEDEEEKKIDDLLIHYSKKSPYDPSNEKKHLKPPPSCQTKDDNNAETGRRWKTDSDLPLPPGRATNAAIEPVSPTEPAKRHARAASMQPEMGTGCAHPKLPDYDELAARVAAFRGT